MKLSSGISKGAMGVEERICEVCGKAKPLISKYWKKTPTGFTVQCSACIQAKALATRQSNKINTVPRIWTDEELEERYQRVLENTTDKGLVLRKWEVQIGQRVTVVRLIAEDKFTRENKVTGKII